MVHHTGEDFIGEEGVAVTPADPFQAPGISCAEFEASRQDRLPGDRNASVGEKIFDIPIAEIDAVVWPNRVTENIWWESVMFLGIHPPILSIPPSEIVRSANAAPELTNARKVININRNEHSFLFWLDTLLCYVFRIIASSSHPRS